MKKYISFTLCFIMMFSTFSFAVSAAEEKNSNVPAIVHCFEEFAGNFVNVFAGFFNTTFNKRSETDIPVANIRPHSWKELSENIEIVPEETIQTETWISNEITFVSEKLYSDPFSDVDVDLLLWGNGRLYTIPGFWAGNNVWKIRFACPSEGVWYYKTICTDEENSALHERTGKIECSAYNGNHDIYKNGFLTTNTGKKYLTYDNGTPFFYLGDTHWSLGDETVDMVKTICEHRVSQGFTVFQSEPIGATFDLANGVTQDDIAGFEIYDEKFSIIADYGLVHANAQFFFPYSMEVLITNFGSHSDKLVSDGMYDLSDKAKEYLEKISRYWVARYGSYPVIWTLGQEVDNDFYWNETTHPKWNFVNNPYKLVAEYIAKYDCYDHPLTAHQENSGATAAYGNGDGATDDCKVYFGGAVASCFRDVPSHDLYAAQWTPSKTGQSDFKREKDFWFNSQGKPVVNYEGQYCYLWTKNYGARMQGWVSYLNGMYGYGWGGHDTWSYLNIYDEDNDSSDGVDTITSEEKKSATWEDSLNYSSSYQMGYMRNFFEKTEWYNLIPRFDNKAYFVPSINAYYAYASNADNTEIVIYFYSFTDATVAEKTNTKGYGGFKTGTVGNLSPKETYTYQWFNPVTNEYSDVTEFTASSLGTFYIGEKPHNSDMVILISKK